MESNKLLIGVQFIYLKNGTYEHLEFELYVLRDILFYQLLDRSIWNEKEDKGIGYTKRCS